MTQKEQDAFRLIERGLELLRMAIVARKNNQSKDLKNEWWGK